MIIKGFERGFVMITVGYRMKFPNRCEKAIIHAQEISNE